MKVLIVGAGAVGQVYGYHFHRGGAVVGFFVREKYAQDLKDRPLVLQQLSQLHLRTKPVLFKEYEVVSSFAGVREGHWDVVVVTISSASLQDGSWVRNLVASLPPAATVVNLGGGTLDQGLYLDAGLPSERLVNGFISFSAWQAPLPNENTHPVGPIPWPNTQPALGYVKLIPLPFSGDPQRVIQVTSALNKGGMMSLRLPAALFNCIYVLPAITTPLLIALEADRWSFKKLALGPRIPVTTQAIGEVLRVVAVEMKMPALAYLRFFIWSIGLRIFLLLSIWAMPFDFEAFTSYHFQKVGAQTKLYCDHFIETGTERKISVKALSTLANSNPNWM